MKLQKWEDVDLQQVGKYHLPFPVQFVKPDKEAGFCPVFYEYVDALQYAQDANLIREVEFVKLNNKQTSKRKVAQNGHR